MVGPPTDWMATIFGLGSTRISGSVRRTGKRIFDGLGRWPSCFADAATVAVTSFISPYRGDRDAVREMHVKNDIPFVEVWVDVPIEVAEQRDPKGLYKKARAGEIKDFTGINAPYEIPNSAEIHVHTDQNSVEDSVNIIVEYLTSKGYLKL